MEADAEGLLVVDRPGQEFVARIVGDLQQNLEMGQLAPHLFQGGGELGVVDDGPGLGVLQQVEEFFFDVAVVDVQRSDPGLEGTQHGLDVLVAVVAVDRKVVLAGFVSRQSRAFGPNLQAPGEQVVGQLARAISQFAVVEAPDPGRPGLRARGWPRQLRREPRRG